MTDAPDRRALAVLILGACIIGTGPLMVRWAEAGPAATAFWRIALAMPMMGLLAWRGRGRAPSARRPWPALVMAGVMFAADIALWHYGLHLTSVANATVLSNLAPVVVAVVAWLVFKERPGPLLLIGLALAIGGCVLIGLAKAGGRGTDPPLGDALSTLTAVFYGGYFLFVRKARASAGTATVMLCSGLVSAPLLLLAAAVLGERLTPASASGWAAVCGLAVMHVTGQGAIAWALGRLPTAMAAVTVLVQPVVVAVLGWMLLGEAVTPLQALGGAVVLGGVALAQMSGRRGPAPPRELAVQPS